MCGSYPKKDWQHRLVVMRNCIKSAKRMLTQQAMLTGEIKPKRASVKLGLLVTRATRGVLPDKAMLKLKSSAEQLRISADPNLMEQAFRELATNAVKAMKERIIDLSVSASIRNSEAVIYVRDNGPGIPWEHRERVFEPYVSFGEPWGGLGLTTVRRIMEAHGGSISLGKSKSGAKFIIRIPLKGNKK